ASGCHTDKFDVYGSLYSMDGGTTWVDIDDSVKHLAVDFFDSTNGWSGGVNADAATGGMWKFDGNLATAVNNLYTGSSFKLYPNPSDGLFYFSFNTENNKPIHITVA